MMNGKQREAYNKLLAEYAERAGFDPNNIPDGYSLYRMVDVDDETAVVIGSKTSDANESGNRAGISAHHVAPQLMSSGKAGEFISTLLRGGDIEDTIDDLIQANGPDAINVLAGSKLITEAQRRTAFINEAITSDAAKSLKDIVLGLLLGDANPRTERGLNSLTAVKKTTLATAMGLDLNSPQEARLLGDMRSALALIGRLPASEKKMDVAG